GSASTTAGGARGRRVGVTRNGGSVGHGVLTESSPATRRCFPFPFGRGWARCLLARVALFPVVSDRIGRLAEPLLVVPELLQDFGGEELGAVPCGMAERLQQTGSNEDRDFVRLETQEPGGLSCVQTGRRKFPVQELGL